MNQESQANQSPTAPAPRYNESLRALLKAFSHHGRPMRGLMSTTKSASYEGRFGRMFRSLRAATYGKTDAESRKALMALGQAMTSAFDQPKDGNDAEESGIPALYTYFGQFVDHDITFDPMTSLVKHTHDPDGITDFRTPALDLDNVYGRGPDDQPYLYESDGKTFVLGEQLDSGAFDLPRNTPANPAEPRRALIGDPRNDENMIVSQFQALMLRFHNRVVAEDTHGRDMAALQRIVRWHYQWVVIHDFLPKIVSAKVLDRLKTHGVYDRKKLQFYKWKNEPFMPLEFSVAAYRLGHSMVRSGYRLNDMDATLLPIFPLPPHKVPEKPEGIELGLTGFQAMAKDHGIDWGRFIDLPGDVRSYGAKDPSVRADAPTKKRLQLAYRLDTSVVTMLSFLPSNVAGDPPPSLPQRNLLRGFELGLPSGQNVARRMGETPLHDHEITIGKAVDSPEVHDVRGTIASMPELAAFQGNCPLWTYILAEAARNSALLPLPVSEPGMTISTPQLGPVGGRIVAEVFLGMLFGDDESFLNADASWIPSIGGVGAHFALRNIVQYALGK